MRAVPLLLATVAAPALAAFEPAKAPATPPTPQEVAAAQRAIADPATSAAVARVLPALSKALLDMPVGEMEAAIEGRRATAADKKRRVRDSVGSPQEAARVERELAASGPQLEAMQKALAAALPGMIAAAADLEKAVGGVGDAMPKEGDFLPHAGDKPR